MNSPRRTTPRSLALAVLLGNLLVMACAGEDTVAPADKSTNSVVRTDASTSQRLSHTLREVGFTGTVGQSLVARLGRPLDPRVADLGQLLWFDTLTGLNDDNTCAGCHSPTNGLRETSDPSRSGSTTTVWSAPIATGPRNQRRTPMVINTAFYPHLMWNSRFVRGLSGDPFDNCAGFVFPPRRGCDCRTCPTCSHAQAFIPPTERNEVAGFDVPGDNDALRAEVLRPAQRNAGVPRGCSAESFRCRPGAPITFDMFGAAIAEFEFTLVFANAPIDRFARGETGAMSERQKRGALLFFGEGRVREVPRRLRRLE